MTAALHLAHAHQPPAKKRRPKRTGGGNGGAFAAMAHQIYQDQRADGDARSLLLAVAYATTMAPLDDDTGMWDAVRNALGPSRDSYERRHGLRRLVEEDVPRYAPPPAWGGPCVGPRLRPHPNGPDDFRNVEKICGTSTRDYVLEKLPDTGWHKRHWFCPRHHDQMRRVQAQVADGNARAPEPIPNRGGLLPCYFDSDWRAFYRWAVGRESWEPPVHGMCADDWPIPGKEPVPSRPRLRLAALDGELTGEA